jgi:hypothetical protein
MSDDRGARFGDRGSALDRAIDGAVREMLDVEPPAGLRGRVLQQIDPVASGFSRKHRSRQHLDRRILWTGLPLAAAAALVLALLLPRSSSPPQAPATVAQNPPAPPVVTPAPPRVTPPVTTTARTVAAAPRRVQARATPRPDAVVAAGDATDVVFGPEPGFPRVSPLAVAPLTVSSLRTASAVAPPQELMVDPIAAPAPLQLEPLPLSPRERQEQE